MQEWAIGKYICEAQPCVCYNRRRRQIGNEKNHKFTNTNWKSFLVNFSTSFDATDFFLLLSRVKRKISYLERYAMQDNIMISMTRRKLFDHVIDLG